MGKIQVHIQATIEVRRVKLGSGDKFLVGLPNWTRIAKTKEEAERIVRRFFALQAKSAAINVGRIEWTEADD